MRDDAKEYYSADPVIVQKGAETVLGNSIKNQYLFVTQ